MNNDRPIVTAQEMLQNAELLMDCYYTFRSEYVAHGKKTSGMFTMPAFNRFVQKSKEGLMFTKRQDDVIEGFFDTVIGALCSGKSILKVDEIVSIIFQIPNDFPKF